MIIIWRKIITQKRKWIKKDIGSFHAQCKKTEKIKNDDLDLFYVYFSSIMSYEYPFTEKTAQNSPKKKKKFRCFYQESWLKAFQMGQVCLAS